MNILVTGSSATGKSTVAEALKAHGYRAIDIDGETDIAGSRNIHSQQMEIVPAPRPHDWFFNHKWVWQGDVLQAYMKSFSSDDLVFFCGNSDNQTDFYYLFDKIFVLTVDKPTLEHRLKTRASNDYGKLPHEFTASMAHYDAFVAHTLAHRGQAIDNTVPLEKVVAQLVGQVKDIP